MYHVKLLHQANEDLRELAYTIAYSYGMPMTAEKYVRELRAVIQSLEHYPERYPIRQNLSLQRYGTNIRRVNYKKMAIIYSIVGFVVYIHRVMPSSMVID